MLHSKRSHEGYLQVDHRACGGAMVESATITCSHCQRIVVLNPDRSRSRGFCPKCDHYICDTCEEDRVLTGICKPFKEVIDETLERAVRSN